MKSRRRYLDKLIRRLQRRLARFEVAERRMLQLRLLLLLLMLAGLAPALFLESGRAWLMTAVLLAVILLIAAIQHRLRLHSSRWHQSLSLQRQYLARLQLNWPDIPPTPGDDPPLLEIDLDLIGPESLLQLLDNTITDGGQGLLRRWLGEEASASATLQRQQLVRELAPLQLLRDRIQRHGGTGRFAGEKLSTTAVTGWTAAPDRTSELLQALRISALLLSMAALCGLAGIVWGLGRVWLLPLLGNFMYLLSYQSELHSIFQRGVSLEANSSNLRRLFGTLEQFQTVSRPGLGQLLEPFQSGRRRPSRVFAGAARLVAMLSVRAHPLFWLPLNAVFPWDFLLAWRLERLRVESGPAIDRWLQALHRLDALCSLGLFSFLHPNYAFPRWNQDRHHPGFESRALGHPLIEASQRVSNDFALTGAGSIALITGSNMSGKSTLLRTVGVNLKLAYAGAPVCARSMQTGIFRVFTCIRISDSVTDGYSYFYAEVKRLRGLLEELAVAAAPPVFFLIDEIFKGTNNRERLLGSRSFIRALGAGEGFGLISTHDLELTQLAGELPGLHNLHFREEVVDGQMSFDYRLHEGPCPTTNALQIMRLAGLPVDEGG